MTGRQTPELPGLKKAILDFGQINPYLAAEKSGTEFDGQHFVIRLFNLSVRLSFPKAETEERGTEQLALSVVDKMMLLHYLTTADGTMPAWRWIAHRNVPSASFFAERFAELVENPFLKAFGSDVQGFRQAAKSLGGTPLSHGDVAFRFLALPRLPLAAILYIGDEEVSPRASVLFDATAPNYLPAEDLSYLAGRLVQALIHLRP